MTPTFVADVTVGAPDRKVHLRLFETRYVYDPDRVALFCQTPEGEPRGTLTKNLHEPPGPDEFYVDANTASDWARQAVGALPWLYEPTGKECSSGFVTYPLWRKVEPASLVFAPAGQGEPNLIPDHFARELDATWDSLVGHWPDPHGGGRRYEPDETTGEIRLTLNACPVLLRNALETFAAMHGWVVREAAGG